MNPDTTTRTPSRHERAAPPGQARSSPEISRGEPPEVLREVQGTPAGRLSRRRGEGDRGGEDARRLAPGDHGPGDPRRPVAPAGGRRDRLYARPRRACEGAARGGPARRQAACDGRRSDRRPEGRGEAPG